MKASSLRDDHQLIIIIIYKENARARGYDLLGPAYLGGQGFGYGGRCREEVV